MWVSKKKWASLEKRVTALEEKLQGQSRDAEVDKICERMAMELSKARELAARLYRSDAQRLFWFRVAVGCATVTAVATGAMMAIAQSAAMF